MAGGCGSHVIFWTYAGITPEETEEISSATIEFYSVVKEVCVEFGLEKDPDVEVVSLGCSEPRILPVPSTVSYSDEDLFARLWASPCLPEISVQMSMQPGWFSNFREARYLRFRDTVIDRLRDAFGCDRLETDTNGRSVSPCDADA
ncbi:MAG: hypothetical protein ACYTBS_17195 [Planctomycetota bacterium]